MDYGTEVKLLAITPMGEELIEYAGRLCWDTTDKTGTVPNRIKKWIDVGHESVIEHASATFHIVASRVLTHELVRHRLASYSQRSQRYVREDGKQYITPPEFIEKDGGIWHRDFEKVMGKCWAAYSRFLEIGIPPEIARYVLPNACETQIVMTMNFRELRHFIKLWTSPRALPEMREVAGKVRDICKHQAPEVFEDC